MGFLNITQKRGDDGSTDLFLGGRIKKTDPRLEFAAKFDSAHAFIGVAYSSIVSQEEATHIDEEILFFINTIRADLINICGEIMCEESKTDYFLEKRPHVTDLALLHLDESLKYFAGELDNSGEKIKGWTLYGTEGIISSQIDLANTQIRELELILWKLQDLDFPLREVLFKYLNRLSKVFYLIGRIKIVK